NRYWKVGEVFIPAKRDKFDRRFRFARFEEVRDAQALLDKIEGTWFGSYKIRANLSRFKRNEHASEASTKLNHQAHMEASRPGEVVRKGVSFKE
ncbi:hypothetical protein A2U01_0075173, partial [Trifolium medium]|nr:hypothetical protein [Trifolium medium]